MKTSHLFFRILSVIEWIEKIKRERESQIKTVICFFIILSVTEWIEKKGDWEWERESDEDSHLFFLI